MKKKRTARAVNITQARSPLSFSSAASSTCVCLSFSNCKICSFFALRSLRNELSSICSDFVAEPFHRFREPEREIVRRCVAELGITKDGLADLK